MNAPSHTFASIVRARAAAAFSSPRLFATALLAVAVVLGAHYRFHRLDRWDMSSDEGASWAAASLPTIGQVMTGEQELDPGKLALYDMTLHGWIRIFGDSLVAMRALSAILGTIAIVLLFIAVREVSRSLDEGPSAAASGELAGAFAALIYATSATMVVTDRTARMYPMMIVADVLQLIFFIRAQRRPGLVNYAGVAIFTATMMALNFTSSFLLFAEALWLGCLLLLRWREPRAIGVAVVRPSLAIAAGIALLGPFLPGIFADSSRAVRVGAIDWIIPEPPSWSLTALREAAGSPALFWIFAGLSVFAVWRYWHAARLVPGFLTIWLAGPLLAIFLVSDLIRPMEFPRYVLIAFVGMFAFAAFGAAALRSTTMRIALAILIATLSASSVRHSLREYREQDWRGAAALAARVTAPGERVAVYTFKSVGVVRYYLPPDRRADAVSMSDDCAGARLLIIRDHGILSAAHVPAASACYPHVLARLHGIEVRTH